MFQASGDFYNTKAFQRTLNQGHRMRKKVRDDNQHVFKIHLQRTIRAVLTQTSLIMSFQYFSFIHGAKRIYNNHII
eukprot:UN23763